MAIHLMKYKDVIQQVRYKRPIPRKEDWRLSYSKYGKRIIIDSLTLPTPTTLSLTSGELWQR